MNGFSISLVELVCVVDGNAAYQTVMKALHTCIQHHILQFTHFPCFG
jgi:hypothetical protein